MKIPVKWSIALIAMAASAGELDPRLLRLIGPDAKYVSGGDAERFRASKLAGMWFGGPMIPASARFQLEIGMTDGRTLYTAIDDSPIAPDSADELPVNYRGVRIWKNGESESRAVLGQSILLHGDPKTVTEAIDRWAGQPAALSGLALTARTLAGSYDAWVVMSKPLDHPEFTGMAPRSPRVEELAQAIVELRVGVRFGPVTESVVEVECKSSDDALALATLAKYLPALLGSRPGEESMVVNLADIATRAQGRTATMTVSLDERKLDEALRERKKVIVEEPEIVK
jgi:hypothetical protein